MLELKNVSYSVNDDNGTADILKDVSLTIEDRKFIVITGPNGGGKTTLAKAIMGIVPLTGGKILLDARKYANIWTSMGKVFMETDGKDWYVTQVKNP